MVRPRDSHAMRLHDAQLTLEPAADVRWMFDVFGNCIAIAKFRETSDMLKITSDIVIDRYPAFDIGSGVETYAQKIPFSYPASEVPDLGRTIERHFGDPDREITEWTRQILEQTDVNGQTEPFLRAVTENIKRNLNYTQRHEPGVQSPIETLRLGSGSCRDYAVLMMEAVRSVGLAARFVSGYLYDPTVDGSDAQIVGAGATHAWVQVYLPGAGWIEFDPTNGGAGGSNLVPIAVAREPSQAIPVSGTFSGNSDAFVRMDVDVSVRAVSSIDVAV